MLKTLWIQCKAKTHLGKKMKNMQGIIMVVTSTTHPEKKTGKKKYREQSWW